MSQEMQPKKGKNKLDVVSVRLVKDAHIMSKTPITNPIDAVRLIGEELCQLDRECLALICMKNNGVPICCSFCSLGCLNQSVAHPREILKSAILANAASMILVHNHPSERLVPSKEDTQITDRMVQLGTMVGIPLLDHIIVGGDNKEYFSFKDKGIMPFPKVTYVSDYQDINFEVPEVAEAPRTRRHR